MNPSKIGSLIYIIRGQRVMLDFDLATIYKVDTKQFSRAVKRHTERFPIDFMFELSRKEVTNLRCQIGTSSWGGRRYLPRAFTEQGVAMLSAERMEKAEKHLAAHGATLGEHAKAILSVFEEIRKLTAVPEGSRRHIGFQR